MEVKQHFLPFRAAVLLPAVVVPPLLTASLDLGAVAVEVELEDGVCATPRGVVHVGPCLTGTPLVAVPVPVLIAERALHGRHTPLAAQLVRVCAVQLAARVDAVVRFRRLVVPVEVERRGEDAALLSPVTGDVVVHLVIERGAAHAPAERRGDDAPHTFHHR